MTFSINTNASALVALRQLTSTTSNLTETQDRISTGLKVRTASDDPANFSIAQGLRGQFKSFDAVKSSLDRATSATDVAIAAGETISDLLIEARETALAAADRGIDEQSREALSDEYGRLMEQIDSIVQQAEFNGTNLVDPSLTRVTALTGTEVTFTDANTNTVADPGEVDLVSTIEVQGRDLTTAGLGLVTQSFEKVAPYDTDVNSLRDVADFLQDADFIVGLVTLGNPDGIVDNAGDPAVFDFSGATFTPAGSGGALTFDLGGQTFTFSSATAGSQAAAVAELKEDLSQATPAAAFTVTVAGPLVDPGFEDSRWAELAVNELDTALDQVNNTLASFGAAARQIELATDFAVALQDQVEIGIGNLVDADLSRESANLQALQVKQQLGLQSLSIANSQPQNILSLFGN